MGPASVFRFIKLSNFRILRFFPAFAHNSAYSHCFCLVNEIPAVPGIKS